MQKTRVPGTRLIWSTTSFLTRSPLQNNDFGRPTCRFFKEALYEMQISRGPGIRQDKMRAMLPPTFLKGSPLQNHDFDYVDEDEF